MQNSTNLSEQYNARIAAVKEIIQTREQLRMRKNLILSGFGLLLISVFINIWFGYRQLNSETNSALTEIDDSYFDQSEVYDWIEESDDSYEFDEPFLSLEEKFEALKGIADYSTHQDFVFHRDNVLWEMDNQVVERITPEDKAVLSFDINHQSRKVVYISGKAELHTDEYDYQPENVYLLDLNSSDTTLIHNQPVQQTENPEYVISIRSVKFSDDGSLIAFTTSDSLWLYTVQTKELRPVFYLPKNDEENQDASGVFGYSVKSFSPDKSKILLYRSYYEGSDNIIVDIITGNITDLENVGYGMPIVYEWVDSESVLVINPNNYERNNLEIWKIPTLEKIYSRELLSDESDALREFEVIKSKNNGDILVISLLQKYAVEPRLEWTLLYQQSTKKWTYQELSEPMSVPENMTVEVPSPLYFDNTFNDQYTLFMLAREGSDQSILGVFNYFYQSMEVYK